MAYVACFQEHELEFLVKPEGKEKEKEEEWARKWQALQARYLRAGEGGEGGEARVQVLPYGEGGEEEEEADGV